MAKVTLVKAARKDIYTFGKRVEYVSKKGKREGQTLSTIDRTIPKDENDKIFVKKGESYYWWTLYGQSTQYSKTYPRPSQLTGSSFLQAVYTLQEEIEDFSCSTKEEFDEFKDGLISQIQELLDETEEKFNNMPENLSSSPVAETLQNRVDELQNWIDEIECIECEEFEVDEEDEESMEDQEVAITNALDELKGTSYNGE